MPSLREIRQKIKSVKSTEQITKAMQMVAAARMRRSQAAILSSRPFALKLEELVQELAFVGGDADGAAAPRHPFFEKRPTGGHALLLVTADKGLCGAFNSNLIRRAIEWLKEHSGQKVFVAVVGRKGRDFLKRLRDVDMELLTELVNIFPRVKFAHAELLGKTLIDAFMERGLSDITVIFNEFKSVATQRIVCQKLLPVPPIDNVEGRALRECGFEPAREALLGELLPRQVKAQLYRILLESQAAELAARMNAMDSATKNARELREALSLDLNRRRQSMITNEIAELVGGAEALVS